MGAHLRDAIGDILARNANQLAGLRTVWFDPYRECENERREIGEISYLVRPLVQNAPGLPQLCRPADYEEPGDDYSNCDLYSMVAWDHVSWPGNDFYAGVRATDDGVKAAATDAMYAMTGFAGRYDPQTHAYLPPAEAPNWEWLVRTHDLRIRADENVVVV